MNLKWILILPVLLCGQSVMAQQGTEAIYIPDLQKAFLMKDFKVEAGLGTLTATGTVLQEKIVTGGLDGIDKNTCIKGKLIDANPNGSGQIVVQCDITQPETCWCGGATARKYFKSETAILVSLNKLVTADEIDVFADPLNGTYGLRCEGNVAFTDFDANAYTHLPPDVARSQPFPGILTHVGEYATGIFILTCKPADSQCFILGNPQ